MRVVGVVAATLVCCAAVPAWPEETIELGGVQATAWIDSAPGRHPVIVFSHGFHGCATQSRFLAEGLAAAGYLVIGPNHRDATCNGGTAHWLDPPEERLGHPEDWTPAIYRDRADDIAHLLDTLPRDPEFGPRADLDRLALAGHSLGGYTVLGLAGGWPGWPHPKVKAVLALSPYSQPYMRHETLGGLDAPVMYQGGTLDLGITPGLDRLHGAFDQSPAPKYLVDLAGAGHLAWTDLNPRFHAAILDYSLAFLDRYVKGAERPQLTAREPVVAELRWDAGGASGRAVSP